MPDRIIYADDFADMEKVIAQLEEQLESCKDSWLEIADLRRRLGAWRNNEIDKLRELGEIE